MSLQLSSLTVHLVSLEYCLEMGKPALCCILTNYSERLLNCILAYLVSFTQTEGDLARILHRLTDQRISTSEQQSFLDGWRVIADDINHEFYILWFFDISVLNRSTTRNHKTVKMSNKLQNHTCGQHVRKP